MKIGSHVNNNGNDMLLGSVNETVSYGANCLMLYMGAPQNSYRRPVSDMKVQEMHEALEKNNISIDDVIIHAPYIVNLAQPDEEKRNYSINFLTSEIKMIDAVGAKIMVLHPGAHMKEGYGTGCKLIADGINQIINNTRDSEVIIALETMAGKGTECGITFEQIKLIIDNVIDKSRIGVCLDTCHINDAGYDIVNNYDGVISDFIDIVGLDYLKVIHINDSKNIRDAHKDRHENIGFGYIGFESLMKFINDPRFINIPKILETPYIPDPENDKLSYAPYFYEIQMIKNQVFDNKLKEEVINANKKK